MAARMAQIVSGELSWIVLSCCMNIWRRVPDSKNKRGIGVMYRNVRGACLRKTSYIVIKRVIDSLAQERIVP